MSETITTSSKRWDLSIEMLKAIAAILVMNSHMDAMYGEYSYLGTGGAIGDALFFFCSGYGIFLSKRQENFFNWYKRRIQRIFPSVLALALIVGIFTWGSTPYIITVNFFPSWFIMCVMLYYILIYPVKRYAANFMWYVIGIVLGIVIVWYFLIGVEAKSAGNIYGANYFKWSVYFLFMLLGAVCGRCRMHPELLDRFHIKGTPNLLISTIGVVLSVIVYYAIYVYTKQNLALEPYQLFSIIPLLTTCWFLWRLASTDFSMKMMKRKAVGYPVRFIGGLCLEILICQGLVFTTELNHIFPWNIPIIMIGVILFAYVLRTSSRLLLQTFQKEDYDWRAMIAPF